MRALILGGTAFLGIALRESLQQRGHEVTLFNRGQTQAEPPAGVRTVVGDREIGFEALATDAFDVVIDTSGYVPHVVEKSVEFFASRTQRYVFISTVSVYDLTQPELREDSRTLELRDGQSITEMDNDNYGPLKALCERNVQRIYGDRATIVRPGLIVGPHDPTDRFTYWPLRFARGGDILAPADPDRRIQFVDVRDVADFTVLVAERNHGGDFNVTSPQGAHTMGVLFETCAAVAESPNVMIWVDDDTLLAKGVAPWMDLPLWIPHSARIPGLLNVNAGKAVNAGLAFRPLADTVRDTLAWARTRPSDYVPKAGLSAQRECDIISTLPSSR
jgi:2'-hydroxyisoflavone reductase